MIDVLVMLGILTVVSAWCFWQRGMMAEREVGRLIDRAGLPTGRAEVAAAERRLARRQGALAIGSWCGSVVGTVPYGLLGATPGALAWLVALALVGAGLGVCVLHYGTVRSARAAGPRVAALRQRRLSDFLTPVELAVRYGMLALPLLAAVLGVRLLTGDDHPARGWALVAVAPAAGLVFVGTTVLQRWVLRANQPATGEAELRWEEALRAAMLRDLYGVAVGSSWALGGLAGLSAVTEWPNQFPRSLASLTVGLYALGTLGMVWIMVAGARGRRTLSRSQQVVG